MLMKPYLESLLPRPEDPGPELDSRHPQLSRVRTYPDVKTKLFGAETDWL